MTNESYDPWDLGSGLLDDFDFIVRSAWFGTNEKIGDGKRMLLTLRGDAFQDNDLVEEEYDLIYTIGDTWEEVGGGTAVKHRSGQAMFNENSAIGRLITSFKELGDEVMDELRERGLPTEASTWEDLAFHVKRADFGSFTPEGETEPRRITTPVATALLDPDEVGESRPKKKAKASSKGKAKAAAAKGKGKGKGKAKPKKKSLRDEVIEFASEYEDHDDFIKAVFDADEFPRAEEAEEDEELSEDILDPDGEVWEESRE